MPRTALGILACLVASLVLLPALIGIFDSRTLRRAAPSGEHDA